MTKLARSYLGKEVDMDALIAEQGSTRAAGTLPLNGRGDLIDRHGRVIKTREELEKEYASSPQGAVQRIAQISLSADTEEEVFHRAQIALSTDPKTTVRFSDIVQQPETQNKNNSEKTQNTQQKRRRTKTGE
jgi:hypothetical protein